jgi:hypothetical protein
VDDGWRGGGREDLSLRGSHAYLSFPDVYPASKQVFEDVQAFVKEKMEQEENHSSAIETNSFNSNNEAIASTKRRVSYRNIVNPSRNATPTVVPKLDF